MSAKSRADLLSEVASLLADNTTGEITVEDFRRVFNDVIDSCFNSTTDVGTFGLYSFSGATQYYNNSIVNYNGDWYKANTTTTVDGTFHSSEWDALSNNLFKATLNLTTAEVKLLNSTPKTIVAAVSGKSILLVSSFMSMTYVSAAYATDTSPYIYTDTATIKQASFPTGLASTVTRTVKAIPHDYTGALGAAATQLIPNKALKITAAADPTAGDSNISVTVFYLLV